MGEKSEVIIKLFGILDVTGEVVTMWIILGVLTLLSLIVKLNLKERPGKFQNIVETGVEYLDNFFTDILGSGNVLGSSKIETAKKWMSEKGYNPSEVLFVGDTASLSVTAGLGILTFLFLQISGLRHNVKHYFKRFVMPMFFMLPLLVLDEFIKPASLALRLYGNIFGEEMVTEELYHIFPIGAPVVMMVLSLLFCALQAMVFTMLVSIYLEEVTED